MSNRTCFISPRETQENGKADQRRTICSATPLDSIRRLIRRAVVAKTSAAAAGSTIEASITRIRCSRGFSDAIQAPGVSRGIGLPDRCG